MKSNCFIVKFLLLLCLTSSLSTVLAQEDVNSSIEPVSEESTEASSEDSFEASTEASTEASSEATTEASSEESTEASSEESTEAISEESTEAISEESTEASGEATTEASSDGSTDASSSSEETSAPEACSGTCPPNYILDFASCKCILQPVPVSTNCTLECSEGYAPDVECSCALVTCDVIPPCRHSCDFPLVLDNTDCTCRCPQECPGTFSLNHKTCACECDIKCVVEMKLNEDTCTCLPRICGFTEKFENGKCVPDESSPCRDDQVLVNGICMDATQCPTGQKLSEDGVCEQIPCDMQQNLCKPESCGKDMYLVDGQCIEARIVDCPSGAFFDFNKPPCPATCEEPVILTACNTPSPGPGCSCKEGFLLHGGECVYPDTCPNKPICLKDTDLMIMMDQSVNIGEKKYYLMKAFVRSLVEQLELKQGHCHRLTLINYSYKVDTLIRFNDYKKYDLEDYLSIIDSMKYSPGLTYLGEALHHTRVKEWTRQAGMRDNVARVLIILTDGQETRGIVDPHNEAQLLREMGIQIVFLKVGGQNRDERERLYRLAGEGGKLFVFGLRRYREISTLLERVIDFQCKQMACPRPRLISKPCIGEFRSYDKQEFIQTELECKPTLIQNATQRRCACPQPATTISDCVDEFKVITETSFIFDRQHKICHPDVKEEKVRCACPEGGIDVGPCEDLYQSVKVTKYELIQGPGGDFICDVVVDDKMLQCSCPDTIVEKQACIGGYQIVTVTTFEFDALNHSCIETKKVREVRCSCPEPVIFTQPCDKKFIDVKINIPRLLEEKEICVTDTYIGAEKCRLACDEPIDVGLIVDTSSSMRHDQFDLVKTFMISLVDTMNIGEHQTLVTLLKFSSSENVNLISDFNTFYHKEALQQRIEDIRYDAGTTSTGEALQVYRVSALSLSHGSRITDGVRQVLFLITDGLANGKVDPVDEAKRLQKLGVQIVVIAIGAEIHLEDVKKLASDPDDLNTFHIPDFRSLEDNVKIVSMRLCDITEGQDHLAVKNMYEGYIKELIQQNPHIENLSGPHFANLQKMEEDDFCRIVFVMNGYLSVIAGSNRIEQLGFDSYMRSALSDAMGTSPIEVRDLRMEGNDVTAQITVDFNSPCDGAEKLATVFSREQFIINDKDNRKIDVQYKIVVVSPETRKAVLRTESAIVLTETLVEVTTEAVKDDKISEDLNNRIKKLSALRKRLNELLGISEDRTIRLAFEVQKQNLLIVNKCRDAVLLVSDDGARSEVQEKVDKLRDKIVGKINAAYDLCVSGQEHYNKMLKIEASGEDYRANLKRPAP